MAQAVNINPMLMAWARDTAGLSIEEAAEKLGLRDSGKSSAVDKLRDLEDGSRKPTAAILQKAAAAYRRPLIAFYLPEPPARADRGEDFRAPAGKPSRRDDAMLDTLIRDVRMRQQIVREYLRDDEETEALPFVNSARLSDAPPLVAKRIRAVLAVTHDDQQGAGKPAELFALLRAAAERAGIFVLLLGDLGSHHSDIGEDIFRGFALADETAPFVVINDNDAVPARSFTLLHELAHIWLGASGVSGPLREVPPNAIERFCNAVAEQFLLPPSAVASVEGRARAASFEELLALTEEIARQWNISQAVVTVCLQRNAWITADLAGNLLGHFAARWREQRRRAKETRAPDEGGPDYYRVRRSRLGKGLLAVVRRALEAEALTHTKAAKVLGVSPSAVSRLLQFERNAA